MKWLLMGFVLFVSSVTFAMVDGHKYTFDDPHEADRFRQLAEELRCPKCQNQNIADSDAPIATDMRDLVYEMINDGQSNHEIVDFLIARYGDFVTYTPPFRLSTFLLWFGPFLLFVFGVVLIIGIRRNQTLPRSAGLSDEERKKLHAILEKAKQS